MGSGTDSWISPISQKSHHCQGLPNAISQKSKPSLRWRLCCGVAPSTTLFIYLQMYMGRLRRLVRILQGLLTTCVGGRSLAKRPLRKRREGRMLATEMSVRSG